MVNFLILIKNVSDYTKKDIDKGNTPLDIYKICLCIKEAFCLSYAIRKQNILYLFIVQELALIKFDGIKLRYLGSDERSQALLLRKALDRLKNLNITEHDKWMRSTPGIYVRTFKNYKSYIYYVSTLISKQLILIFDKISPLRLYIVLKLHQMEMEF